jgi:hypothetical protein
MTASSDNSKFKVVRILDEYRIIINAGKNDGVDDDSYFDVTGAIDKVYDPDTKELLGTLDGVKASVSPVKIFEKMCICKAKTIPLQGVANTLSPSLLALSRMLSKSEPLPVDKSQISNPETYSPIMIGDRAVLHFQPKYRINDDDEQDDSEALPQK